MKSIKCLWLVELECLWAHCKWNQTTLPFFSFVFGERGAAAAKTTRKEREEPPKGGRPAISRKWIHEFVGYGRWPSCSAPIPLIFSFPIQRLISCCSPHASLLPLFFGAQPKKKSWNEDKLRQLNNKWKRGMIWRKWKQRREWSWVDWIENI